MFVTPHTLCKRILRASFARPGSRKGRGYPLLHHLGDRLAAGDRIGIAAEIAGAQRAFAERALDRRNDRLPLPFSPCGEGGGMQSMRASIDHSKTCESRLGKASISD